MRVDGRASAPRHRSEGIATRFVWVADNDPGLADLINDAEHYSDADGEGWDEGAARLGPAARRILAVLKPEVA